MGLILSHTCTHLHLHVHTAGQPLPRHLLDGVSAQAVPVASELHRLDEFTLRPEPNKKKIKTWTKKKNITDNFEQTKLFFD